MTDTPTRKIGGLTRRTPDPALGRLLKANRDADANTPHESVKMETAPSRHELTAEDSRAASKPQERPAAQTNSSRKSTVTVYVPEDIRARSRAAFKATQRLEDDASYSDMITKAIAAEVARREALYNDGEPFTGGHRPLPTGRPLAD